MMIKVNDDFEIRTDPYNWILDEWFDGKDKEGNLRRQKRTTFHANLEQICGVIIDRSASKCESLDEIIHLLKNCIEVLKVNVESI